MYVTILPFANLLDWRGTMNTFVIVFVGNFLCVSLSYEIIPQNALHLANSYVPECDQNSVIAVFG